MKRSRGSRSARASANPGGLALNRQGIEVALRYLIGWTPMPRVIGLTLPTWRRPEALTDASEQARQSAHTACGPEVRMPDGIVVRTSQ